jgi:ubiquinone/menaquinone biosynthesis C-methylase UbiE
LNRKLTNTIRFLMDEGLPVFIRDSRWFMYPFFWYWFKGKKLATYMDFKKLAWGLSEEEFNRIYRELDCRATDRPTDLNDKCIRLMMDKLDQESISLLDVGCGRGHWLSLLSEQQKRLHLTGCDVFEKETVSKPFDYRQGSIYKLPFEDKSFDIVTCHHTIEHLPELNKAIAELKRVARKQLIIVTPRQRYYYYTLDLHLHFFPEKEYLLDVVDLQKADCTDCDGDWCLVAGLT